MSKKKDGNKLEEQAYKEMRKLILNGVLPPGEQLVETGMPMLIAL